jgi:dienelactone hydrolase
MAIAGFSMLALAGFGQEPDIRQAPPPINFEPWKLVTSDERTEEYSASFPSPVQTPYFTNNIIPVQVLLPKRRQGPIPVVLILHYWGAIDLRVERNIGAQLNSHGIGAVVIALPYHLSRTPQGSRSGALAIAPDPAKLKATMLQCVLDVRRTYDWMETRPEFDKSRFGIVGTSLGGIVAALVSGLENRISAASYVLGGVDLAHVLWHSSRVVTEREELRGKGYTEEKLRTELAPIEPQTYLKELRPPKSFVVVARYDTVVPPESGEKLIAVLSNPAVLRLETGHYGGFFVQKRVHHEVAQFFANSFAGQSYAPPERISAPTVRIGVSLYPERGLQVSAGLDVWRGDAAGNYFANVQLAPRGAQFFIF